MTARELRREIARDRHLGEAFRLYIRNQRKHRGFDNQDKLKDSQGVQRIHAIYGVQPDSVRRWLDRIIAEETEHPAKITIKTIEKLALLFQTVDETEETFVDEFLQQHELQLSANLLHA